MSPATTPFISADAVLVHRQGHGRVTRRLIEALPEDQLFTFSIGGMRPFGALALELLMAVPIVRGAVSGDWSTSNDRLGCCPIVTASNTCGCIRATFCSKNRA